MVNNRILSFDFLRASAILLIVACHLHYYFSGPWNFEAVDNQTMFMGLGTFFFISGYLLQMNDAPKITTNREILCFYLKKIKRLVPLIWFCAIFSLFLLAVFAVNGATFAGLASFNPITSITNNWFIVAILVFYFLFPLLTKFARGSWGYFASISVIFLASEFIWFQGVPFDFRIMLYFPIFFAGVLTMKYGLVKDISYWEFEGVVLLIIGIFAVVSLNMYSLVWHVAVNIGVIIGCVALLALLQKPDMNAALERIAGPVQFVAISAFCVFLLHNAFLTTMQYLILTYHLEPFKEILFFMVAIPITIIVSYYIQQGETLFWKSPVLHATLTKIKSVLPD